MKVIVSSEKYNNPEETFDGYRILLEMYKAEVLYNSEFKEDELIIQIETLKELSYLISCLPSVTMVSNFDDEILELLIVDTEKSPKLTLEQLRNYVGCAIYINEFEYNDPDVGIVRQIKDDEIAILLIEGTLTLKLSEYEKSWVAYNQKPIA